MRESGLSRLFALHVFNAGGDAAIAVGLAGTLFFQVPSGEARGRVALYLLLTMAPFALVAPLLGPFLDRFRHGRRWAIGSTMAARAFFCWVLAGAISTGSTWLYPVAFGCLVASKAYGIARSASVPRVLPEKVALVTANSRISLSGVVGAAIGGGVAAAASRIGPGWALRWGFAVFIGATILAIRLPARIDSTEGESGSKLMLGLLGRTRRHLPREVLAALQINTALRAFSGFLLVFLAFLLRDHPFAGVPHLLMYAMVGAAAGGGSMLGTGLGAVLRARPPRMIVRAVLVLAIAGAVAGALFFGPVFAVVSALIGGLCQQLGKLSLDATIQKQVSDDWRTSVFARSETMLQIGWVLGGVLGIVVPLWAWLGFTCAAVWMAGAGAWVLASRLRHHGGSVIASA
jgi:MFS family permease